jgi:hypothetical protein
LPVLVWVSLEGVFLGPFWEHVVRTMCSLKCYVLLNTIWSKYRQNLRATLSYTLHVTCVMIMSSESPNDSPYRPENVKYDS